MAEVPSFDSFFIGGKWVPPTTSDRFEVVNPATEEVVGSAPAAAPADVDAAVAAAKAAFDDGPWPRMSAAERADVMAALHAEVIAASNDLAELITIENGSPLLFSHLGQVGASAMVLDYFVGLTRTYPFEEVRQGFLGPALVRREPVGVCAGIIPWNVPLFITMLKLAPALASGSTIVLKPAPETPLDALVLAQLAEKVGLPDGVLNVVPADRGPGEHLVTHPDIDKVSFTGSTAVGRIIGETCGRLLRPVTLELGGKSAAIILDDADLNATMRGLKSVSLINNGQTCFLSSRILAPRSRYGEVVQSLAELVSDLNVGDPLDSETEIGPVVSARQRDRVLGYIESGKTSGAKLVVGGGVPRNQPRGWFVSPTVFADVHNSDRIAQEEIFGPVLAVIPYDDDEQAVALANDSEFGLAGTVWSTDVGRATEVAREIRTGTVGVNGYQLDIGAPFGGVKASGIGRELGPEGLDEFFDLKSIYQVGPPAGDHS